MKTDGKFLEKHKPCIYIAFNIKLSKKVTWKTFLHEDLYLLVSLY